MHTITADQMRQIVIEVVIKLHEPVIFLGPFGAGKTQSLRQICEEEDFYLHPVLLGQYDTVDLKGTPWVSDIGDGYAATVWRPASTLPFKGNPNFPTDKPIILFLDERTSATVPVMGICYQLVDERRVGEHELMDNVFVISAGNRASDKGIVNREPMPLCNRETAFEFGIDVSTWCSSFCQPKYGKDAAIFVAFLQFRKELICTWNPDKPERVVATPRTIEKAIRYYLSTMPHDIKLAAMAGCVGDGWTAEFWGFHDSWQQIAGMMPRILKDPDKAPLQDEPSMQYALTVAISGTMDKKTITALHTYLVRMPPEFVVLAWQLATKRDKLLYQTNEFIDFSKKFKAVM